MGLKIVGLMGFEGYVLLGKGERIYLGFFRVIVQFWLVFDFVFVVRFKGFVFYIFFMDGARVCMKLVVRVIVLFFLFFGYYNNYNQYF